MARPEHALSPDARLFRDSVLRKIRADVAAEAARAEALRAEVAPRLGAIVAAARADGVCGEVWLFGSFASGAPRDASDVDILVAGNADELAWRIGSALGRRVDAWRLEEAPEGLVTRARDTGVRL